MCLETVVDGTSVTTLEVHCKMLMSVVQLSIDALMGNSTAAPTAASNEITSSRCRRAASTGK